MLLPRKLLNTARLASSNRPIKRGHRVCGDGSALALLHKDIALIHCHSGDLQNRLAELLEARKLIPQGPDIEQALQILENRNVAQNELRKA